LSLILIMNCSKGQTIGSLNNFESGAGWRKQVSEHFNKQDTLILPYRNVIVRNDARGASGYLIKDTLIPTPDSTLRKLLVAGYERNNLKKQVINLEEQINLLNDVIKEHTEKDELQQEYFNNQMKNLQDQLAIAREQVKAFETIVRKERRKRRLVTVGGVLTTGAALFLSLKK
jgi:hypothetical protein